jgi:hypothetical protein
LVPPKGTKARVVVSVEITKNHPLVVLAVAIAVPLVPAALLALIWYW